jgi:hypothetical protein
MREPNSKRFADWRVVEFGGVKGRGVYIERGQCRSEVYG